jgi:hypothetical protein
MEMPKIAVTNEGGKFFYPWVIRMNGLAYGSAKTKEREQISSPNN